MNIYDIAEKSGVSIATVSRVLNDNPNVRAQTRERVLAVIAQEGYTPNAFARGLGLGTTGMIGVLCVDMCEPLYADLLDGIARGLRQDGLDMLLRCADNDAQQEKAALEYFVQKRVDAVVLLGSRLCVEDAAALLSFAQTTPLVVLDGCAQGSGLYTVVSDVQSAMESLMGALMMRHKRRVLFLYDTLTDSCRRKLAGYRAGCDKYGEPVNEALLVAVESRVEAVNDCIKRLLVRGVSFDAVIGAGDMLALAAQKALHRIGLSMPVIGFNNTVAARCATPELTSVDVDASALCTAAIDRLRAVLAKEEVPAYTVLPTTLVERDSFRLN